MSLATIRNKVESGIRINEEDALFLFQSPDVMEIGRLADLANRRKNGELVYYNVNRHINPTNICAMTCKFCAYSRKPGEEGGYEYSIPQILEKVESAWNQGAREIHMVGGLHPRWRLNHYIDILSSVKAGFPDIHIKAFTAVEIDWLARRSRKSIKELLQTLKDAGLGSMPGGGAEIFHQDVRDAITAKLSTEEWIDVHRTAHRLGLNSNCTMLYGHVEDYWHRVDHLMHLRNLQDETGGFNAFIPLSFQPHNNEMGISRYTFGPDDLKTLAISRIYLDNFNHIKAYWIMLGQDIAQTCLNFGANDIDGTVTEEKISNMAGSRAGMIMSKDQIEDLIIRTHHDVCERDTLYQQVGPIHSHRKEKQVDDKGRDSNTFRSNGPVTELVAAAQSTPFHTLCSLAVGVRDKDFPEHEAALTPAVFIRPADFQAVNIIDTLSSRITKAYTDRPKDLPLSIVVDPSRRLADSEETISFSKLCRSIRDLSQHFTASSLIYSGLLTLQRLSSDSGITIAQALSDLKECGISLLASSPFDDETRLSDGEIAEIHRQAHNLGIQTIAKAELAMDPMTGQPMWRPFIERIQSINEIQRRTGGCFGLSIEPGLAGRMTATEYLEAVAVARIISTEIPRIICDLSAMPISRKSPEARGIWDPATMKVSALPLLAGASDLGFVDIETVDFSEVLANALAAGITLHLRGTRSYCEPEDLRGLIRGSLRHIPATHQQS